MVLNRRVPVCSDRGAVHTSTRRIAEGLSKKQIVTNCEMRILTKKALEAYLSSHQTKGSMHNRASRPFRLAFFLVWGSKGAQGCGLASGPLQARLVR